MSPDRLRTRRAAALGSVVAVAAALASACGSSPGATVDSVKLDGQIASGLAQRYHQTIKPTVTCPASVANKAGTVFNCKASISGQDLEVNAEVNTPDDVRWQPAASVISLPSTEQAIDAEFAQTLGGSLHATCGGAPIKVVAVDGTFTCTASVGGSTRTFQVTATDLAGTVSLSLLPPASGPGSTTPAVTAPSTPGSVPSGTLPGD